MLRIISNRFRWGRTATTIRPDIFSTPVRIKQRHWSGLNVMYSDSSAVWIERNVLKNDLPSGVRLYGLTSTVTPVASGAFDALSDTFPATSVSNPIMQAIWEM